MILTLIERKTKKKREKLNKLESEIERVSKETDKIFLLRIAKNIKRQSIYLLILKIYKL